MSRLSLLKAAVVATVVYLLISILMVFIFCPYYFVIIWQFIFLPIYFVYAFLIIYLYKIVNVKQRIISKFIVIFIVGFTIYISDDMYFVTKIRCCGSETMISINTFIAAGCRNLFSGFSLFITTFSFLVVTIFKKVEIK